MCGSDCYAPIQERGNMAIEQSRDDLDEIIKQQKENIKKLDRELGELKKDLANKTKEVEHLRLVDIGKTKDLNLCKADCEGYRIQIQELENLERIRVAQEDFKPASSLPMPPERPMQQPEHINSKVLWTPVSNCVTLLKSLRPGIDAYNRYNNTKDTIVFETDPADKSKIVAAHHKIYSNAR